MVPRSLALACVVAGVASLVGVATGRDARAASPKDEAHAAYERGLAAHKRGDERAAADGFGQADAWLPSDAALEAAIESAARTSDPAFVMRFVAQADATPGRILDAAAARAVREARATYGTKVGRLVADCSGAARCLLVLDGGAAVDARRPLFVAPGRHSVRVVRDADRNDAQIDIHGGETVSLGRIEDARLPASAAPLPDVPVADGRTSASEPAASPDDARPARPERSPLLRPLAYSGIGLTAVLTGLAIASGVDTASKHASFTSHDCGEPGGASDASCATFARDGQSAQTRTDWLVAASAVAAVATVSFVVFARPFADASVEVTPREARLVWRMP